MKRQIISESEKYINYLEKKNKEANEFILEIAKMLGIEIDSIEFDGIQLSIDDFQEALNKLLKTNKFSNNNKNNKKFIPVEKITEKELVDIYFDLTLLIDKDNKLMVIDNSQEDWKNFTDCNILAIKEIKIYVNQYLEK